MKVASKATRLISGTRFTTTSGTAERLYTVPPSHLSLVSKSAWCEKVIILQ